MRSNGMKKRSDRRGNLCCRPTLTLPTFFFFPVPNIVAHTVLDTEPGLAQEGFSGTGYRPHYQPDAATEPLWISAIHGFSEDGAG